jgi:PAS domain-containing protein
LITQDGKLLHISENASEYLGYSVEEIMCQGDTMFDLVDNRDHGILQERLSNGPPQEFEFPDECAFACRMNLSRTAKRQVYCYKVTTNLESSY